MPEGGEEKEKIKKLEQLPKLIYYLGLPGHPNTGRRSNSS